MHSPVGTIPGPSTGSSSPKDEGYVEHDLIPHHILSWPEDQRAELAIQLLRSVSSSTLSLAYRRLTPLIEYRDFLALLPYELTVHVLSYLDAETLYQVALVSKAWSKCASDPSVWKALYLKRGWTANEDMINWYLASSQRLWQLEALHYPDFGHLSEVSRGKRRAVEELLVDGDDIVQALPGSEDHDTELPVDHEPTMLLDMTYPGSNIHDLPTDVMMVEQIPDEEEQFFTPVANSQQLQSLDHTSGTTLSPSLPRDQTDAPPTSPTMLDSALEVGPATTTTQSLEGASFLSSSASTSSSNLRPATFPRSSNNISSKYNRFLISPSNILPTIHRPRLPSYNLSGSFITPPNILKRGLNRATPPPIRIPPRNDTSTSPPGLRPPKFFYQYSVPFMRGNVSGPPGPVSPVSPSSPTLPPTAADASSPQPANNKGLWSTIRHGVMGVSVPGPSWPSFHPHRHMNSNSSSDESTPESNGGGPSSAHRSFHNLSPSLPAWLSHLPSPLAYTSKQHREAAASGVSSTSPVAATGAARLSAQEADAESFHTAKRDLPQCISFDSPAAPSPSQILPSETIAIHQCPESHRPIINWKYLYQQRKRLESNWVHGRHRAKELPGHKEGIYCIQFDEYKIISGSRDNTIKIWDFVTGECLRTYSGHAASVLCLQYDNDCNRIVSGSSDMSIILWELDTGTILQRLTGHSDSVLNVRMEKDTVVSCSKDRTVKIWQASTGELLRTLTGHRAAVNAVQFSPEGSTNSYTGAKRIVVSASGDRTIKIWSFDTGECLRTLEGHTRGIACIQFEGDTVISGSSDQTIKIWDLARGECLRTLTGHLDLVRTLQFNKGRIISGGYDETIKIWDQESGALLVDLQGGHAHRIFKLQFNESKIVSCSQDQKIVIWDFAVGVDMTFIT